LVLLAESASADLVVQAHGDDIDRPNRARLLVDAFRETGASMVASLQDLIDAAGKNTGTLGALPHPTVHLSIEEVIGLPSWLIGSAEAWNKSDLAVFPRLDSARAATSHDRILPFRASLVGGTVAIAERLVARREHPSQWGRGAGDHRSEASTRFGDMLGDLGCYEAMRRDLEVARTKAVVDSELYASIRTLLDQKSSIAWTNMFDAHVELVRNGRLPLWVTEDELRLAREGMLRDRLAEQARRWGPALHAVERVRRRWR
jgi:hypothetical protein